MFTFYINKVQTFIRINVKVTPKCSSSRGTEVAGHSACQGWVKHHMSLFLGGIIKLSKFVFIKITKLDIVFYGLWFILAVSRCRWSLLPQARSWRSPGCRLATKNYAVLRVLANLAPATGDRPPESRPPVASQTSAASRSLTSGGGCTYLAKISQSRRRPLLGPLSG